MDVLPPTLLLVELQCIHGTSSTARRGWARPQLLGGCHCSHWLALLPRLEKMRFVPSLLKLLIRFTTSRWFGSRCCELVHIGGIALPLRHSLKAILPAESLPSFPERSLSVVTKPWAVGAQRMQYVSLTSLSLVVSFVPELGSAGMARSDLHIGCSSLSCGWPTLGHLPHTQWTRHCWVAAQEAFGEIRGFSLLKCVLQSQHFNAK